MIASIFKVTQNQVFKAKVRNLQRRITQIWSFMDSKIIVYPQSPQIYCFSSLSHLSGSFCSFRSCFCTELQTDTCEGAFFISWIRQKLELRDTCRTTTPDQEEKSWCILLLANLHFLAVKKKSLWITAESVLFLFNLHIFVILPFLCSPCWISAGSL